MAMNGGAGTPAGWSYPAAQNLVEQYLTGSVGGGPTPFNQYAGQALAGFDQNIQIPGLE